MRAPEILFQPGMVGVEEAGLAETIAYVLKMYSPEDQVNSILPMMCEMFVIHHNFSPFFFFFLFQDKLVSNIFLTGGCAYLPGLKERLECELRAIRPFQSKFHIRISKDPSLSAWNGACEFARQPNFKNDFLITKEDYTEKGGEYLKEHSASNVYCASPAPLTQTQSGPLEDAEMEIF